MKQSLQLRTHQTPVMTPQLQQAIHLLQLSNKELKDKIQSVLDSNMMLEEDDELNIEEKSQVLGDVGVSNESELKKDLDSTEAIDEIYTGTTWEDISESSMGHNETQINPDDYLSHQSNTEKSLRSHLLSQLNLISLSEAERSIAITIIDFINEDGYLVSSLKEIQPIVFMAKDINPTIEELKGSLKLIQSMEPAGVGARDLGECLNIQLLQLHEKNPWVDEAKYLARNCLDLLANHNYKKLMKKLSIDNNQLEQIIALIQSLNPKPGSLIQDTPIQYITPDIYVNKKKNEWAVELNSQPLPRLKVNTHYASMIKKADNSNDNISLKEHLQEAKWLIKSMESRNETLLRVTACIVEKQAAFLESGEEAMRPLVLDDIAEELGMHESTVSRATTNKYLHTPKGTYSLKYFFSSSVNTNSNNPVSSMSIRAIIKKLVLNEDVQKPLSDSKIAKLLEHKGVKISRRTIAKYREVLLIPRSNERKKLA